MVTKVFDDVDRFSCVVRTLNALKDNLSTISKCFLKAGMDYNCALIAPIDAVAWRFGDIPSVNDGEWSRTGPSYLDILFVHCFWHPWSVVRSTVSFCFQSKLKWNERHMRRK